MIVVRVGIDEGLDYRDCSEQRNRRNSRGETEKEQERDSQLLHHRDAGGNGRIEQRHAVLFLKQLHREFKGVVFEQTGLKERRADADASGKEQDRQWKARKPRTSGVNPCDPRRVGRPSCELSHQRFPIGCPVARLRKSSIVRRCITSVPRTPRSSSQTSSCRSAKASGALSARYTPINSSSDQSRWR